MNAAPGFGSWSLAGRVPHDGRHGAARHHAPQQPRLLRTGHRPILEATEAPAADRGPRPPTAAARLLAQKPWIVPIPGTTKLHRLEENLGGADVTFTAGELADIDAAASKLQLAGDRLPKAMLDLTGQ